MVKTKKIHLITEAEKLLLVVWNTADIPGLYRDPQQSQEVSFTNKTKMTSSHTYLLASDRVNFVCTTVEYRTVCVHMLMLPLKDLNHSMMI